MFLASSSLDISFKLVFQVNLLYLCYQVIAETGTKPIEADCVAQRMKFTLYRKMTIITHID